MAKLELMAKQEYVIKNREWLEAKRKEPGVKPLDKGLCYKVIRQGNMKSATPNRGSVVTVHYTGRLITGKSFDSKIAIPEMTEGSKWEIYIPAEMGYGKLNQPGIPGGSTLVFEIELLAIN